MQDQARLSTFGLIANDSIQCHVLYYALMQSCSFSFNRLQYIAIYGWVLNILVGGAGVLH